MEEDMFDTHLCLVCNQTIVGLINYVMHKKNQCQGKKPAAIPGTEQTATGQGSSFQSHVSSTNHLRGDSLLDQTHNGGGSAMLGERNDKTFSSQLLFPPPPTDTFTQSLQTLTEASFTSTTTVTMPSSSTEAGQYSEIESCQTLSAPSTQSERLFPITNHQMNSISSLSQDNMCSTANSLSSSLVTGSVQSSLSSTHQNNEPLQSLSFNQDANQNSHNALSVEVQSSLSSFINANLSPITGSGVDPNSVIPSATSGHCEDFFQSLELQSKGAKEQKSPTGFGKDVLNHSSKPFDDDDHADIDLPISKILSNLDFSSDEDMVDLPSDDELDCDFDVYSDEDFDIPPNSHTGGKWKPGEGPGGKKIKWRLGAGPIRHGGKWKPGMSHGKYVPNSKGKQIPASKGKQVPVSKGKHAQVSKGKHEQAFLNGKIYECKLCHLTFENRYLYSNHFGSKLHKDTVKEGEKGKDEEKEQSIIAHPVNKIVHVCTVCNQKFHRKYEIAKHLVTNFHRNRAVSHPESLPMYQKYHSLVLRFSPYQCQICKFYFNRETDFFDHLDTSEHLTHCEQIIGKLCCSVCEFTTDNPETLTYHIKGPSHLVELKKGGPTLCIIKDNVNKLKCKYCGMTISSTKRMKRHIAYRHPEKKISKPFVRQKGGYHPTCPDCGKVCVSSSALTIHIRRNHTMERPFKCDPCGKAFSVVSALNSHLKSQRHENNLRKIAAVKMSGQTQDLTLQEEIKSMTEEQPKDEVENQEGETEMESEDINLDNYEVVDEGGYSDDANDDILSDPGSDSKEKTTNVKSKKRSKPSKRKAGKIIKCEHCDFVYVNYADLKTHCEVTHPNEIHHCDLCLSTFMSKKAYRIHCSGRYHQEQMEKNSETGLEQFKCSVCDMKFLDERWRNFHFEYQHNHLNNEVSLKKINKGEDMVTQLYGDHLQLLEDLPKTSSLSCPECGKFLKKHHLVEHLRLHTGEKPYTCRFCDKSFVAKLSLRRHLMIHMGLTENICEICGRHFKKLETYRIHMERHSSEKKGNKCICDVCGMVFTLQRQVEAHMKRHGERKFKCTVDGCTWTFVMKHELKMHMLTHTKEKKFLCDICGFAATTKNRLQRHVRTHSGVRDYHCSYCPYKAGCSTHLRRHMRIHVGSKPFKCPYCPYTCNTHENVRKHITKTKKHQGLKIYPCKFCNFGTNAGKEFRDHLLLDHPGEVNGDKLDSLSVISGLYVRGEDIIEPQEGTEIVQVKERPPKIQKNALFQNMKSRMNSTNPDIQAASDVLSEAASLVNQQPEHPICSIESYWSGGSANRNHWFNPASAAGTMSTLNPDPAQLYPHPVSNADSCFLVNVAHSDVNTAVASYHEGSVASVVVVSSDF